MITIAVVYQNKDGTLEHIWQGKTQILSRVGETINLNYSFDGSLSDNIYVVLDVESYLRRDAAILTVTKKGDTP